MDMGQITPGDWRALSNLLDVALALPADERAAWLDQLDGEHQPLTPMLRVLFERGDLAEDLTEAGGFLDSPPHLAAVRLVLRGSLMRLLEMSKALK
jgi:hypothetical protein